MTATTSEKQSINHLMAEFEAKVMAHPILKQVRSELLEQIHAPAGQAISAIVGPTGAGKSTLSNHIEKEILLENEEDMRADPGYIPIVRLEVPAPELSRPSWGDFYKRTLTELKEPLIEQKGTDLPEMAGRKSAKGRSVPDLRRAVENSFRYRRTRAFLVDEAQHLTRVPHGRHLKDQMETIKSIANLSRVKIILIGTYELLDLLSLNGQSARRTGAIHFSRYRYEVSDELKAFQNIVGMFQSRLPLPCEPSLVDQTETMYMGTLGCVGLLKDWLSRALWRALKEGSGKLTIAHLRASAYHTSSLKKIAEEIREGESRLAGDVECEKNIRFLLGMPQPDRNVEGGAQSAPRRTWNVGQRAPSRDKVGV
ncbi:MAG TPA: ATP-binding protein [Verrucomicrobiae bacterium]|jgi:type II secretory pathway predicted ATPase ExeA|nr:ATP-binding protein [Verrucomicrobiae bacterium]